MASNNLLDTLLTQFVSTGGAESLGKKTGADTDKVQSLLSTALPMLVGSMADNAADEKGAESLANALDDHASTPTSNLLSMFLGADTNDDEEDGAKILSHILGGEKETEKTSKKLAKSSGLSSKKVISILCAVAPLLLNLLGNTKQQTNTSSSGLSSMLSLLTGGSSSKKNDDSTGELLASVLTSLLK